MKRIRENFDFGWRFHLNDVDCANEIAFNDSSWRQLNLPHDWSIEGPFDKDAESGQSLASLPGGVGLYRKAFKLEPEDKNKRIFIEFDGVYRFTDVWINAHHLGFFPDGYTSFQYELTEFVVFDTENIISVRVDNSQQPNSRWYSGSGIYRHTWLTKTAPVYIVKDTTYITTPSVSPEESSIYIVTTLKNELSKVGAFMVNVEILDANGQKVVEKWDARYIDPGKSERFALPIWINNIKLWDIDNPYLYTARFNVYEGDEVIEGKLLDSMDVSFGIRSIEFHKDNGFFLNGKHIKIQGVALHHEAGLLGAAVPDKVWERRLKKLRGMGCNSIRTAHSAASPELLDICDQIGMMVFDELHDEFFLSWEKNHSKADFGGGRVHDARFGASQYFGEWGYKNTVSTIRRDRNHPSVIIWGIGNEIYEQAQPNGPSIARKLVEIFHLEDPTRPTMPACNRIHCDIPGLAPTVEYQQTTDLIGYNHISKWGTISRRLYAEDKLVHPHWKVMGSENANIFGYRGTYSLDNDPSSMVKPYYSGMLDVESLWKFTKLYDYVMGDYLWAGIDYLGEWPWPYISAPAGLLDTCGFEKDSCYFFASQWGDKPVIKLLPHWNWQGQEGRAIPVVCYTNCDEAELFVNGQSYGTQAYDYFRLGAVKSHDWNKKPRSVTTNNLHLLWMVPYSAGEIRVVGKKDGKVFEDAVNTCGDAKSLILSADCTEIKADGKDICHVEVKLFDVDGNFACVSNAKLKFSIEGAGQIFCLDNGNPTSHEIGMYAEIITAFNGLCLAYIKADNAGEIKLTVSGDDIKPQSVNLMAVK